MQNVPYEKITVNNPMSPFSVINYEAHRLDGLEVTDKKGNVDYLQIVPSVEMRFTQSSGKRIVFYFDTVVLTNDTIYGSTSRFLNLQRKIPVADIIKIEVQDGKKNFNEIKK